MSNEAVNINGEEYKKVKNLNFVQKVKNLIFDNWKKILKTIKGEDSHRQHVEEQAGSDQVVQGGASFESIHLVNGKSDSINTEHQYIIDALA